MRIEAVKLSPAKCKIKARMRIEAANLFWPNVRRQTDRQTTEISTVKRTTWGSLRLAPTKTSQIIEITDSEARRQEKLRRRRKCDRQRRAEEIAEQREERLARLREREIEQVSNYMLPR